jgi:ABC-2 type transport system permease protein
MEANRTSKPTLRRVLQLWGLYARMDFLMIISDLRLGLIFYFCDAILNIALVTGMLLLAERFVNIGMWSYGQIVFMMGYATTANGIVNLFGSYNVGFISRRIGRGQFDHSLVQPLPIWLVLLSEGFMPFSSSAIFIPGIALLIWGLSQMTMTITFGWVVLLLVNLMASAAITLAFSFLWGSLAFWAPRSAEEVSTSAMNFLTQLKVFPLDGLGPILLTSLMTVIPVGFVAWFPSRALLGLEESSLGLWVTPLVAIVLSALAGFVFIKGMQHYGRTGSQHYRGFGHRG